jgi:curved DNA-binding protein CbpA
MPAARSHYDTLNVSPDAELVVVEAAYRALMKKYHPDQGPPAEGGASAADINLAYSVLRDSGRRAEYDRTEYIRQKDMRIAHYRALEVPRQSKLFGWGGWIVALLLTAMLAIVASKAGVTGLSPAEAARAANAALPGLNSQPDHPDERVMRAAEDAVSAQLRMNAIAAGTTRPLPAVREGAPAGAGADVNLRAYPPRSRSYRSPRRHAPSRTREEKDFLVRQGYIY